MPVFVAHLVEHLPPDLGVVDLIPSQVILRLCRPMEGIFIDPYQTAYSEAFVYAIITF